MPPRRKTPRRPPHRRPRRVEVPTLPPEPEAPEPRRPLSRETAADRRARDFRNRIRGLEALYGQKRLAQMLGVDPRYIRLIKEGKRSGTRLYLPPINRLWKQPGVQTALQREDRRIAPKPRRESEDTYLRRIAREYAVRKIDLYELGKERRPAWARRPSQAPRRKATDWYATFRVLLVGEYQGRIITQVREFVMAIGPPMTANEFAARRAELLQRTTLEVQRKFPENLAELQLIDVYAHGQREYL